MIAYILKSLILSGVLTAYYRIMLRDKKMHHFNRFYLLFAVAASLLLPFCNFDIGIYNNLVPLNLSYLQNNRLGNAIINKTDDNGIHGYLLATLIVSVFLFVFFISKVLAIYYIKYHHLITRQKKFYFIETTMQNAPFSFLNNLFWRTDISIKEEPGLSIFKHELAHISGKHSLDRLYMQSILCLFWLNPFFWMMQKELLVVHEYIADAESVEEGDTDSFAQMLLRSIRPSGFLEPAHFFSKSLIKRRLNMISNFKKPGFIRYRKLLVIPVIALVIGIFLLIPGKRQQNIIASKTPSIFVESSNEEDLNNDSLYLYMTSQNTDGSIDSVLAKVLYVKSFDSIASKKLKENLKEKIKLQLTEALKKKDSLRGK